MALRCTKLALSLIALITLIAPARAQQAEHAFIFVIDGIRASEAFDDPDQHYLAAMWNQLAPLGSTLSYLEIRGQTLTLPAHQALVTGNYADFSNTPAYIGRRWLSSRTPTLFASYRNQTGAGLESCWIVSNTPLVGEDCTSSVMPGYDMWPAADVVTTYDLDAATDVWVWDEIDTIMDDHEVGLMMVNLHEVDLAGHAVEWWRYELRAIEAAGDLAAFWNRLQADPVYADNTVLAITTDHGRHLDGVSSGWGSHGCECVGCRKAFLQILGPGIRQGYTSDEAVSFLDLAPTIAHLMGLEFPYHRGRVLTEILEDGDTVDPGVGGMFNPRLWGTGGLIVRTAERQDPALLDAEGAKGISVEISEDGGETWIDHSIEAGNQVQLSPMAWTDGETVLVGWLEIAAKGAEWNVRLRRLGATETEWQEVFYERMIASGTPVSNLQLMPGDDPDELVLLENNSRNERIRYWTSDDLGVSWSEEWQDYDHPRHFPRDMGVVAVDDTWILGYSAHAAFNSQEVATNPNENTEIFWMRSDDQGETWSEEAAITDDIEPSIQPRLALTPDGVVHAVWSDAQTEAFQLYHAESTDDGMTFSPPVQLTFDALGAWEPAVAVDGDHLFVAWSRVGALDQASVHLAILDGDGLVDEQTLSSSDRVARTPTLMPLGDCTSLVTWSEGNLDAPWALESAVVITAGLPASSATGSVEPAQLEAGDIPTELVFELLVEVTPADQGIGRIELVAPDAVELVGTATLEVAGDLVDGTVQGSGGSLSYELQTPLASSATLALRVDATATVEESNPLPFEVLLLPEQEGCTVEVEGAFDVTVTGSAGDDDDDTTAGDDDDGCLCEAIATPGSGPLAAVSLLALLLAGRRRS